MNKVVNFDILMEKYKNVFVDILGDMELTKIENGVYVFEDDSNQMTAKVNGDFINFRYKDDDIEKAIREAKQFEQQDALMKERLVFKNEVENLIIRVESALAQHGKEIDKTLKSQVKDELSRFKKMTKKVKYETCSQEEFETIKQAKIQLENTAGFLLSM